MPPTRIATMAAVIVVLAGCTQPENAARVLRAQGYTSISMDGVDLLNCSEDDFFRDRFSAVAPGGQRVTGVVCSGILFKGSTVRLD